nr:HAMP domain-containing histidine kinase [Oscillospiraceae bacterium]
MLRRLRIKFICVNMGIVAAMLAVIFGLELHFTRQDLEGESLRQLQLVAERLDRPREEGEGPRERPLTEPENAARPDLSDQRGFLPYLLLRCGADGSVEEVSGNFSYDGDVSALAVAALAASEPSGVLEDSALRYLRTETPEGLRIVFTDMSGEQNTMDGLLRTSLLVGAASLALFFLLSLLLARWAVKPVEEAWDQQKQFVSDASHELKTPLTVITTNAELLQSPDFDQSARSRFADNILTMSRQMRGLVEGLLELARVDAGAVAKTMEELDLGALCAETVLPFEPLCYERGLTLNTELEEAVRVCGSAVHLRQAVEILLDNAQKYAHSGTEVWLRLERRGKGHCVLSVTDTGDPIAPEDLPHLFERFYRADKARARNGSYGLGLAIAKQVTEAHRGRISCESREGVTKFSLL